jgi:hypothetical protein
MSAPQGAARSSTTVHRPRLVLSHEDLTAVQREVPNCVLRLFARRGLITPEAAGRWDPGGGFSLHAAVHVEATDRKGLESQGQGGPCWARRGRSACSGIVPAAALCAAGGAPGTGKAPACRAEDAASDLPAPLCGVGPRPPSPLSRTIVI